LLEFQILGNLAQVRSEQSLLEVAKQTNDYINKELGVKSSNIDKQDNNVTETLVFLVQRYADSVLAQKDISRLVPFSALLGDYEVRYHNILLDWFVE